MSTDTPTSSTNGNNSETGSVDQRHVAAASDAPAAASTTPPETETAALGAHGPPEAIRQKEAEFAAREARIQESEAFASEMEAETRRLNEDVKKKLAEVEKREQRLVEGEGALDRRQRKLDEAQQAVKEREDKVEQREGKVSQRQKEFDDREGKRKEAERELKKKEAEVADRDRKVKERELEAEAGFERQNRAALAVLEKEHAILREQIAALRKEAQELRAKEFAALGTDLARKREEGHAAMAKEIEDGRTREEKVLEAQLAHKKRLLEEHANREESRIQADHARREKEMAEREAAQRAERERLRTESETERVAIRKELADGRAKLEEMERALKLAQHNLKLGEETLRSDTARLQLMVEDRSRDRVRELEDRLRERTQQAEDRLALNIELERQLDAFEELRRRFPDQSPEDVIRERDRLRADVTELREQRDARPTLEDKQRFDQAAQERDRFVKELGEARRKLAELGAERNRWLLGVADLEQQRELRESEERRRAALEAQSQKLAYEVERLKNLYEAPKDKAKRIESIEAPWRDDLKHGMADPELTETAWIDRIVEDCRESGLEFNRRLVLAFHTALKTSDWSPLAVLAGVSGTGKSELPRLYARFGGLAFMPRPVQPNWDSPQSLFGFFNSLDNRFDATPLLRALAQSQHDSTDPVHPHGFSDHLLLVLLDEFNLAHVEQYFSDLLSKLEERRGVARVDIDIELGGGEKYPLQLGRNVLWVGTMNEDETTKSLSDKVIDRCNLIYFPRPQKLKRRTDATLRPERPLLARKTWERWLTAKSPFTEEEVGTYKRIVEQMNECLEKVGRALGHRVWQAIEQYMANHPEVTAARTQKDSAAVEKAMRRAFEDQLVQKAMPKLRGIPTSGRSKSDCLDPIERLLTDAGLQLSHDFAVAMRVGDGAFVWNSARYIEVEL